MAVDPMSEGDGVTLHWIPVGAGSRVVPLTSACWERWCAARERRSPVPLFHAALSVRADDVDWVVEMAPAWQRAPRERGVVIRGPVGLRMLGWSRLLRYEVRCWRDGTIPDASWARASSVVSRGPERARAVLGAVAQAPPRVWGLPVPGADDMWNSNSLVSFALVRGGIDITGIRPPDPGRAPGWRAGLTAARD